MACPKWLTEDQYEYQFQVNYLGHYLLTRLLLDKLAQSSTTQSPSRVINLTSKLYETGVIDWNDINFNSTRVYEPTQSYKQSKLCNILFTNYLQDSYPNLVACSVSPGVVLTNLGQHIFRTSGLLVKLAYLIFYPLIWFAMKTPKQGAQTTIYCAVENDLKPKSGFYFRNMKQVNLKPNANSKQEADKLWNKSEELVKKWL
jgi:NAD(P)-dependent dehydrogenase (short-subunit alcohol dehydrogenase family)